MADKIETVTLAMGEKNIVRISLDTKLADISLPLTEYAKKEIEKIDSKLAIAKAKVDEAVARHEMLSLERRIQQARSDDVYWNSTVFLRLMPNDVPYKLSNKVTELGCEHHFLLEEIREAYSGAKYKYEEAREKVKQLTKRTHHEKV